MRQTAAFAARPAGLHPPQSHIAPMFDMIRNSFCSGRRSPLLVNHSKWISRNWGFALSLWLIANAALTLPGFANSSPRGDAAASLAPARIDLSLIAYQGLSRTARLAGDANVTLDFIDDDHVFFTFNPKKLFVRHSECPPDHEDRLIDAAVFEVSSGKLLRQTEWYVHDRRRYLWPLGSGQFLLRRLNNLYQVDSSFQEKLLFTSPTPLLWVTVAADGGQIVVETDDLGSSAKPKVKRDPAKRMVKIQFIDIRTLAVQRTIKSQGIVNLETTTSGFADLSRMDPKTWLIRFGPTGKERRNIARVHSRCTPDVFYSSGNTLLIGRCAMGSTDYSVSGFTVTGRNLWRQHWSQHRYLPVVRASEHGSRFAFSTLQAPPLPPPSEEDEDTVQTTPDLEQNIQVVDTASGNRVLLASATSALIQQNFSLSPDGNKLALLHDSTVEIYHLPEMSEEERAKYTAVKADVPGLFLAPPVANQETGSQGSDSQGSDVDDPEFVAATNAPAPSASENADANAAPPAGDVPAATAPATQSQSTPVTKTVSAKSAPRDAAASLTLRVRTQVVAVDVVVTDSQGHPVKGLQQKDFAVKEDGKPQGLRYFKEIGDPDSSPIAPPHQPDTSAPNIFTNDVQAPKTGAATVVLFDLLNTPVQDRRTARDQLLKFLKSKPGSSQFALCALSDTLRMIQGLTPDENQLATVLIGNKGAPLSSASLHSVSEGKTKSASAKETTHDQDSNAGFILNILARDEAALPVTTVDERMYRTLDAFTGLARYLSGFPGRKNLIWLSGSFPPGIFAGQELPPEFNETKTLLDVVRKTTNLLADSNVAVYPVSVAGMQDADKVLTLASNADAIKQGMLDQNVSQRSTMDAVAQGTGGKAFDSANGIDQAMAVATAQGSHYYALSYSPADKKFDGRYRKIKVALAGQDYHLAYRTGYYAVNPDAPARTLKEMEDDLELGGMQQGAPQSRQLLFATRVAPVGRPRSESGEAAKLVTRSKKNRPGGPVEIQHYAIDYVVTPSQLHFALAPDGTYHGVLGFMVGSFDNDGKLLTHVAGQSTSDLNPQAYKDVMTGGLRLHQEVDVPVAAGSVRVAVEDLMTSSVGTLEVPLPVKAPPDEPSAWSRSLPEIEPD
jgi:VWFA-related protein